MSFRETPLPLPGGEISCRECGSGPAVLFIHGSGGARSSPGLERLAETRRVIAPVLPGFDGTARREGVRTVPELADLLAAVIEAAAGGSCDVIGHSFGAAVAATLALRQPERVQQLVLAGLSPEGLKGLPSDPAQRKALAYAHPEHPGAEDKPTAVQAGNFAAAQQYSGDRADIRATLDRLGEIKALTLILHGTKDGITPLSAPRILKERIPRSHLVYLYDAAHMIDCDQPARFAVLVEDFLARGEAFIVHSSTSATA